jgi:hypothetical protein
LIRPAVEIRANIQQNIPAEKIMRNESGRPLTLKEKKAAIEE